MLNDVSSPGKRVAWKRVGWKLAAVAVATASTCFLSPLDAKADAISDLVAQRCKDYYASVNDANLTASNNAAAVAIRNCVERGIDPPLKARVDQGLAPSGTVSNSRMPTALCNPFESCYSPGSTTYGKRGRQTAISSGGVGTPPPRTSLSAPEFTGFIPPVMPEHLQGGGILYIYDGAVTPPCDSMVYNDTIPNYYSDCSPTAINNGYVAIPPPATDGNVMSGTPIVLNSTSKFNFVDGGIVVLPMPGPWYIDGIGEVPGGQILTINHAADMVMPAGTKLYPFPEGSLGSMGTHYTWPGWKEYSGPPLTYPPSPPAIVIDPTLSVCTTQCQEPIPGTGWLDGAGN